MTIEHNPYWMTAILSFVLTAIFLLYRFSSSLHGARVQPLTIKAIGAVLLMLVAILTALPDPGMWQLRLFGIAAFQLCLLIGLDVVAQLSHTPLNCQPIYLIGIVFMLVCLALGWHTRANIELFTDRPTWTPTTAYILYFGLAHSSFTLGLGGLAVLCLRSIRTYTLPAQTFRHTIHGMAYAVTSIAFGIATMHIGLFLITTPDAIPSPILNRLYHGGKTMGCLLYVGAMVVPDRYFHTLLMPFQRHVDAKRHTALQVLHTTLVQLVPGVHLPVPSADLHAVRMPIEINDARDVVWSHMGYEGILTADAEAQQLRALASAGRRFAGTGPYDPPPTQHDNDRHIQQVATYLRHWKDEDRE